MKNTFFQPVLRFFKYPAAMILFFVLILFFIFLAVEKKSFFPSPEQDFAGMFILRQTEYDTTGKQKIFPRLTKEILWKAITEQQNLLSVAEKHGWDIPYEEMLTQISVKERLSSRNSFLIHVDTGTPERSANIAKDLVFQFFNDYRTQWQNRCTEFLNQEKIKTEELKKEVQELKELKDEFSADSSLYISCNDFELASVNSQLSFLQQQFLSAYGAYITSLEEKYTELKIQRDLALQLYTEHDTTVKQFNRQLSELENKKELLRQRMKEQKPELYRLSLHPKKLTGLPENILYFYENIQELQRIKLFLIRKNLLEEKEGNLQKELQLMNTLQDLLDSNSCDIFFREV